MPVELASIREALQRSREQLLSRANVVATGIGYKVTAGEQTPTLSVICSVIEKIDLTGLPSRDRVPETVDGVPTDVIETGRIRALQSHTDRHRPAPGVGQRNYR